MSAKSNRNIVIKLSTFIKYLISIKQNSTKSYVLLCVLFNEEIRSITSNYCE